MEEREEREVSAVSLSSFYCTCPDVSMSVPVLEFPVTNSFRYGRIPAPLWHSLTFRFSPGRTGDPDSLSFRTQRNPDHRLSRLNLKVGICAAQLVGLCTVPSGREQSLKQSFFLIASSLYHEIDSLITLITPGE